MRLIDGDRLLKTLEQEEAYHSDLPQRADGVRDAIMDVMSAPAVDAVPVVRCKDCIHRPTGEEMEDLEFPDNRCPCRCEDYWYSWKPSDDWFCPYGERKDGE